MPDTIRSFIAFEIDNASVLERISTIQKLLSELNVDVRLVKPENIHITLRFLGNIKINTIKDIFEFMKNVQFTPFDVNIDGIGVFPNLRYPRVIWAGITQGTNQLSSISMQLNKQLRTKGFISDSRSFSPHITFARIKSGKNKSEISKYINEYINFKFGIVRAECLVLKKSELTPKGAIYSTIKSYCP